MKLLTSSKLLVALVLGISLFNFPSQASAIDVPLTIAIDKTDGYSRDAFKHWIDADKNGCDTRAEVLIEEAIVKPKVGPKCKLTGGKWLSEYDGKVITNPALLDIDHVVPLAEAWRSGAWSWTAAQRQAFANELDNSRVLIAVTLSTNRSKGDKDPSFWMPTKGRCGYTQNWLAIKYKFSLTVDASEAIKLKELISECRITNFVFVENGILLSPTPSPEPTITNAITEPSAGFDHSLTSDGKTLRCTKDGLPRVNTYGRLIKDVGFPCEVITPGAFCAIVKKVGVYSGVIYTCKSSSTDTRNRWRL